MFEYDGLAALLENTRLEPLLELVPKNFLETFNHGDLPAWIEALKELPDLKPSQFSINNGVNIGSPDQMDDEERQALAASLKKIQPWRKGPFNLFGLSIDTEWRSDWKWDRVQPHISPLHNRKVLDVGCGNGYHCWRMAGEGAKYVIGIDSHLLFTLQYWAIRHFLKEPPVFVLPVSLEQLPKNLQAFDTVFSMGVLYHRRDPIEHLYSLKECLRSGGELVLETLIVEGEAGMSLVPQGRYARMPNVWFLPSIPTLVNWLEKSGYKNVRVVDDNWTSVDEQRTTEWMTFESLPEALDKNNPQMTIEGYPAPRRATFIAEKP